jgi:predicted nucleic acid-binding protein
MAFVADDSVIVGWFIASQPNELTRKVSHRSRRERVHVPALWQLEFSNVLVALERRGLIAAHEVDGIAAKAERFGLEIHDAFASMSPLISLMRNIHGYCSSPREEGVLVKGRWQMHPELIRAHRNARRGPS